MPVRYKLSHVVLPVGKTAETHPALFCRSDAALTLDASGGLVLEPGVCYDFSTYLGSCSTRKWNEYAGLEAFYLSLVVKGAVDVVATAYDATIPDEPARLARAAGEDDDDASPEDAIPVTRTELSRTRIEGDGSTPVEIALPEYDHTICAFELVADGPATLVSAWYSADVDEAAVKEPVLSIAITTFKKEEYVARNVRAIEESIFASDDPYADNVYVHIVDNGRPLPADLSSDPRVYVHPSDNVGGSGGFARGMIESVEQREGKKVTHVLLMDDDVEVLPEAIFRAYNLIALGRGRYDGACVAGAMMSLSDRDWQVEDVGHLRDDGIFGPIKPMMHMSKRVNVLVNEQLAPDHPRKYSAFWFSIVPVKTIEEYGLTMPFFVRVDDAEYGMRQPDRVYMTMNGVCVWHIALGPEKFRATMEYYLTIRNCFVLGAVTPSCAPDKIDLAKVLLGDYYKAEIRKFGYDYVDMMLDGFEDFMKGPEFLSSANGAELLAKYNAVSDPVVPLDPGIDDIEDLYIDDTRSFFQKVVMVLTENGQKGPEFLVKDEVGLAPNNSWYYPAASMCMKRELHLINEDCASGIVRVMDRERYREVSTRYQELMARYRRDYAAISKRYRDALGELVGFAGWKRRLGLDDAAETEERNA